MKYEFRVYLRMLQGGSGRHATYTDLYFSYKVPFHSFLRALQDATQLCTIPPRKINAESESNQPATSKIANADVGPTTPVRLSEDVQEGVGPVDPKTPSSSSSSRTVSVSLSDRSSSDCSSTLYGRNDLVMESQKVQFIKPGSMPKAFITNENNKLNHSKDGGYTLGDGPWSYMVVNTTNLPSARIWQRLADTDDYVAMLEKVKWHIRDTPKDEIVAILMHVSTHMWYGTTRISNFASH
jgi:hypothetical protein